MAIEIKELIIKMTVSSSNGEKKAVQLDMPSSVKNKIVKECVEKVMQKLQSKIDR
ncbi:DUF5908 family protein [Sporocytophaga myxococcoides]|uniref:DUF5908 family protein n=1 Tax=Sporocytophaga myxococcoides TaxID=153721 RepID=UPI00042812BA|nr:DUF5908 family protein [Sporocytophaga myxococcoides]